MEFSGFVLILRSEKVGIVLQHRDRKAPPWDSTTVSGIGRVYSGAVLEPSSFHSQLQCRDAPEFHESQLASEAPTPSAIATKPPAQPQTQRRDRHLSLVHECRRRRSAADALPVSPRCSTNYG